MQTANSALNCASVCTRVRVLKREAKCLFPRGFRERPCAHCVCVLCVLCVHGSVQSFRPFRLFTCAHPDKRGCPAECVIHIGWPAPPGGCSTDKIKFVNTRSHVCRSRSSTFGIRSPLTRVFASVATREENACLWILYDVNPRLDGTSGEFLVDVKTFSRSSSSQLKHLFRIQTGI